MPINNTKKNAQALRLNWVVFCKSATVDQTSNQISLFNVIDELTLHKNLDLEGALRENKKVQIKIESALVMQVERENLEDLSGYTVFLGMKILDPKGVEIGKLDMPWEIPKDKTRVRAIINFTNLVLTGEGYYSFVVSTRYPNQSAFSEFTRVRIKVNIR